MEALPLLFLRLQLDEGPLCSVGSGRAHLFLRPRESLSTEHQLLKQHGTENVPPLALSSGLWSGSLDRLLGDWS